VDAEAGAKRGAEAGVPLMRSRFLLGLRITIIDSGVDSGLRIGSESISESSQNRH
jgi:hypothetical protein